MDTLPTQSKRITTSNPAAPNARILLIASGVLILSSAGFFFRLPGPWTGPARALAAALVAVGVATVLKSVASLMPVTMPQQVSRLKDHRKHPREPQSPKDGDYAVAHCMFHRSIDDKDDWVNKREPFDILRYLLPDERLAAMRPRFRWLVLDHARRGSLRIWGLVFLGAGALILQLPSPWNLMVGAFLASLAMFAASRAHRGRLLFWGLVFLGAPALLLRLPSPWNLMVGAFLTSLAMLAAFHAAIVIVFRGNNEQPTSVHNASEVIPSAGHPQMLHAILENKARALDTEGYRVWLNSQEPDLKVKGVKDTGTFESHLFVEEQPFPIKASDRPLFSRIVFPAGCAGFLLGVWAALIILSRPLQAADIPNLIVLAAWTWLSYRAAALAWDVEAYFQFESKVSYLILDGTFSRSHVRIGKGMVDSIESDNVAVRSDIRVRYCAAQALTEARGDVRRSRALVTLNATPETEARIRLFQEEVMVFRNTGIAPLRIDLASGTSDVIRANLGVRAALGGADLSSAPVLGPVAQRLESGAARESEAAPTATVAGDDTKVCPDCAETIKAAAKKCRYCGHVFEAILS